MSKLTTLDKQARLFKKCAGYFQDNLQDYRNVGYNAKAGQALWEGKNGYLFKLKVVNDIFYQTYYVMLQVGKRENQPTEYIIKNVGGLKDILSKFHKGQAKLYANTKG